MHSTVEQLITLFRTELIIRLDVKLLQRNTCKELSSTHASHRPYLSVFLFFFFSRTEVGASLSILPNPECSKNHAPALYCTVY